MLLSVKIHEERSDRTTKRQKIIHYCKWKVNTLLAVIGRSNRKKSVKDGVDPNSTISQLALTDIY
jgi:hypothetical protein